MPDPVKRAETVQLPIANLPVERAGSYDGRERQQSHAQLPEQSLWTGVAFPGFSNLAVPIRLLLEQSPEWPNSAEAETDF